MAVVDTAATYRPARSGVTRVSRLRAEANTRRPALVGTTDVTCNITSGPPTRSRAAVHDDHRTVVEVADALARAPCPRA